MSRIMLVDDEPLTTRTLQALIQDEMPEVEVYSGNSAVQAMELLKEIATERQVILFTCRQ